MSYTSRAEYKEDGSEWYNYFQIRLDDDGHYYFAWIGTRRNAFGTNCWRSSDNMKAWIHTFKWREAVDAEFEKEVLSGS